jgi:hypothetical protein
MLEDPTFRQTVLYASLGTSSLAQNRVAGPSMKVRSRNRTRLTDASGTARIAACRVACAFVSSMVSPSIRTSSMPRPGFALQRSTAPWSVQGSVGSAQSVRSTLEPTRRPPFTRTCETARVFHPPAGSAAM